MFVYAIGQKDGLGPVKIGMSADPPSRLSTIQTSYPYPLQILAVSEFIPQARSVEARIHKYLDEFRLHGEWFDIPHSRAMMYVETPFTMDVVSEEDEEEFIIQGGSVWAIYTAEDFCRSIADVRQAADLTQDELSALADIERTYLAKLETGSGTRELERTIRALRRMGAKITVSFNAK